SRFARIDVPFTQWHLWYDWNFFIVPAKGYEYLLGRGNVHEHMECEWDCGAFGNYDFHGSKPTAEAPGPMFGRDWAWPVGDDYVWLSGRWIYDCGHPNSGLILNDGTLLVGDISEQKSGVIKINTKDGRQIVPAANVRQIESLNLLQS